jgi:hypothetical protein
MLAGFAGAAGGGGGGGIARLLGIGDYEIPPPVERTDLILYLSCGEETGPGKVYQVDEHGRVLGVVPLPYTATGITLHRQKALVLAVPRDGGHILRIDSNGKLSSILDRDKNLIHPVDVSVPGGSDSVLVADNITKLLAAVPVAGGEPKVFRSLAGQKWTTPEMSVAVTPDGHVIYGTNGDKGVYRFADVESPLRPLLPDGGGVATDVFSSKWAAAQRPNFVYVYDGEQLCKKLRMPPNHSVYRQGLISFGPAGTLVVASRSSDRPDGPASFLRFGVQADDMHSMFVWDREPVVDFVVGPRMYWGRESGDTKSAY